MQQDATRCNKIQEAEVAFDSGRGYYLNKQA